MPAPAIPTGQAMEELILVAVLGLCIALALILRSLNESVRNMDQKLDALTAYVQARLGQIASQRREMSQSRVDEVPRTDTATAPGAAAPMAAATSHEEEARTPPATAMDSSGHAAAMAEKRLLTPRDEILGEEEPRHAH